MSSINLNVEPEYADFTVTGLTKFLMYHGLAVLPGAKRPAVEAAIRRHFERIAPRREQPTPPNASINDSRRRRRRGCFLPPEDATKDTFKVESVTRARVHNAQRGAKQARRLLEVRQESPSYGIPLRRIRHPRHHCVDVRVQVGTSSWWMQRIQHIQ